MAKLLVVEDEKAIRDLLNMSLTGAGYECTLASDGLQAVNILEEHYFDLILLDIMLPEINGYEVFEYVKPLNIPVIFLTAKGQLNDRVKGLTLGAEDYIVKPFEIMELLARVNVVLRRFNKAETILKYDNIIIDIENMLATRDGVAIELTPKEFDLLVLFVRNLDITLFRDRIYEIIWQNDFYGDTRTLDLHIQRLRKKTGLGSKLKTIYKVGYRLEK